MNLFQTIATQKFSYLDQLDEDDKSNLNEIHLRYCARWEKKAALTEILEGQKKLLGEYWEDVKWEFERYADKIKKSKEDNTKWVFDAFFEYLNQKYKLKIAPEYNTEKKTFEEMLDLYFSTGGIVSLKGSAEIKIKHDFKNLFRFHTTTKKSLRMKNVFYIDKDLFGRKYEFSGGSQEIAHTINKALVLFETGELATKQDIDSKFDWIQHYRELCSEEMYFGLCKKIFSIKMFINGSVAITFPDQVRLNEFLTFFDLK